MNSLIPNSQAKSITVLVVDDEVRVAELVAEYIKDCGYNVITCFNGSEALKIIEQHAVDLVVLDVVMPDMSGCQTAYFRGER